MNPPTKHRCRPFFTLIVHSNTPRRPKLNHPPLCQTRRLLPYFLYGQSSGSGWLTSVKIRWMKRGLAHRKPTNKLKVLYFSNHAPSYNSTRRTTASIICLLESSTCFEQLCAHLKEDNCINPLNAELNPICHLLALLGVHFLHVSRIRVKSLTLRLLMSYIYGAPILDVSRSHTTHHSR